MNKLEITIPSKVNNLHMVENFIESFTTTFNLSSKLLGKISLAVIEAFTNAIKYGNSGDATKMVTVVAEKIDNQLKVTLSDEGEGFDYSIIPDPTIPENIEKESKRGLFLMKTLSNELIFENNGATIIMMFNL